MLTVMIQVMITQWRIKNEEVINKEKLEQYALIPRVEYLVRTRSQKQSERLIHHVLNRLPHVFGCFVSQGTSLQIPCNFNNG